MQTTERFEKVPVDRLVPYARNARTHSKEQILQLRVSLREFGFVNPVICDRDFNIVAGHGRVLAAKAEGMEAVPCVFVEHLTDAQKKAYILADNRLALSAGWDEDLLALEFGELQDLGFDLELTGFDPAEIEKMFNRGDDVQDDDFDVAAELEQPAVTRPGDIWLLGRHRLICGDSTLPETYAALMDGRAANLVVTDPPYNVNYEGSAGRIKNDNMDGGKFYEFLLAAFRGMEAVMASDASIYVFHADTEGLNFRRAFADAGFYLSGTCIWKKQSLVLGRSPYQWQHEPVLFGWKKKGKHAWYSDRKQSTIWEFDKPRKNGDHPTMKPIPLMAYPILKQTGARYIVRRLTPRECAKLQGFPPDWCAGLATPEPTEEDIAFWAGVFETHRRIMGKSSKPKSRSQIVKWLGYSPIAMAKNAVGLALATEEYGAAFFANGANPGGVLEHPGVIKDVQRVKESWNAGYQGSGNAHKIALLEDGMKFHAIGIPPEQAQFLETRKFQINEIARIFRIPPHLIGDLEKATFSNIEHQSLEFVKYTLDPWVVRWEQSLMQMLLLPMEKQEYFIKFNLDGLLRGDTKSRNDSYATGRQNGWLSANDIRELEDMNRIPEEEGGDAYLVNGNMISITTAMQQTGGRRTGDAPTEE